MVEENIQDSEGIVDTKGLSQSEYVDAIQRMLAPALRETLEKLPPPDYNTTTAAAAYIQALMQFAFDISNAFGVHPIEFVRAVQIMARDIEMETVEAMTNLLKNKETANQAPTTEASVDF